jgi:hypothetical protein
VLLENEQSCTEQLARFFPRAMPVRIPVQVTAIRSGRVKLREATVVEFSGTENVIFSSTLPLEFDDRVRIENSGRTDSSDGIVIAVQYQEGRKAVAIRFTNGPCNWVTQA